MLRIFFILLALNFLPYRHLSSATYKSMQAAASFWIRCILKLRSGEKFLCHRWHSCLIWFSYMIKLCDYLRSVNCLLYKLLFYRRLTDRKSFFKLRVLFSALLRKARMLESIIISWTATQLMSLILRSKVNILSVLFINLCCFAF